MDNHQVCNARHGVPTPPRRLSTRIREEQTRDHHGQVGKQRYEDVAPVQAGEESQIEQDERRRERPVDVARPEHLAEDVLQSGRQAMLVVHDHKVVREGRPAAGGLSEVGEGGDGSDEGGQEMEESFLLFTG